MTVEREGKLVCEYTDKRGVVVLLLRLRPLLRLRVSLLWKFDIAERKPWTQADGTDSMRLAFPSLFFFLLLPPLVELPFALL